MKRDVEAFVNAVVDHYLDHGEPIGIADLATTLGWTRAKTYSVSDCVYLADGGWNRVEPVPARDSSLAFEPTKELLALMVRVGAERVRLA